MWLGSIWGGLPHFALFCVVLHSKGRHSGTPNYDWHFFECGNSQHVQLHMSALEKGGVHTDVVNLVKSPSSEKTLKYLCIDQI